MQERDYIAIFAAIALAVFILIFIFFIKAVSAEPFDNINMRKPSPPEWLSQSAPAIGYNEPPGYVVGGRPAGCPVKAWCGCGLAVKIFGKPRRDLWPARAWLKIGRPVAAPRTGAIAIFKRGSGGHVGLITAVLSPNRIMLWSANDGGAVRERERSTAGILGYRYL